MKATLAFVFAVVALLGAAAHLSAQPAWLGVDDGLAQAASHGKYAMVKIYTPWCTICKKMEATSLSADPVLKALGKDFVSIKLNAEGRDSVHFMGRKFLAADLALQWGVESYPTIIFITPQGRRIGLFPSFADEEKLLRILKYISSGARERREPFDSFTNAS